MTDGAPQDGSSRPTLRDAVARLTDALLGLVRTRFELASIEYAEERSRVGRQLALMVAAVGCLLISLLFAASAVVVYYWESHRLEAIIGVAVVFAVIGAMLLWRRTEVAKLAPTPFAATLAEFDKDRATIARLRAPENDPSRAP